MQFIYADSIINFLLPGFSSNNTKLTVRLFKYQAFLSLFSILSSILTSLHYTHGNLFRTIIYPTIGNSIQFFFVWLFSERFGLYALLYGLVISQSLNFILLSTSFIKKYKFILRFDENVKDLFSKIIPLLFSSIFSKSNIVFDRYFLSILPVGSITIIQYGEKIIKIISGFLNQGLSIVTLTKFSSSQNNEMEFQNIFYKVFKAVIFIICPLIIIIINYSEGFFEILKLSDRLSSENIKNIYNTSLAFLGILIGGSLSSNIANAFYAKGLTKIISKTNVIVQISGLGLKYILFLKYGFWGLPIGASIVSLFNVLILYYLYHKYIFRYNFLLLLKYLIKIIIISISIVPIINVLKISIFKFSFFNSIFNSILFVFIFFLFSFKFEKDISVLILKRLKFK